jgi:hypothetical protein
MSHDNSKKETITSHYEATRSYIPHWATTSYYKPPHRNNRSPHESARPSMNHHIHTEPPYPNMSNDILNLATMSHIERLRIPQKPSQPTHMYIEPLPPTMSHHSVPRTTTTHNEHSYPTSNKRITRWANTSHNAPSHPIMSHHNPDWTITSQNEPSHSEWAITSQNEPHIPEWAITSHYEPSDLIMSHHIL